MVTIGILQRILLTFPIYALQVKKKDVQHFYPHFRE